MPSASIHSPGRFPFPQDGNAASLPSSGETGNAVSFGPLGGG